MLYILDDRIKVLSVVALVLMRLLSVAGVAVGSSHGDPVQSYSTGKHRRGTPRKVARVRAS